MLEIQTVAHTNTKYKSNKKMRLSGGLILTYFFLILCLAVFLFPFLWMLITSVKAQYEVLAWPPVIWPKTFHFDNFIKVFQQTNLLRALVNSVIVTFVSMFINVVFSAMAAYAFSRLNFKGNKTMFGAVLLTMMIPPALLVVPMFLIIKNLPFFGANGWVNTYAGLMAPYFVMGFSIFLFKQYLETIPKELDEQASIDGCGPLRTLFQIILPMMKPAVGLVCVFSFITVWNDYLWPLTVVNSPDMDTLQIALKSFQTQFSVNWPLLMAGATVAVLPPLLLYLFLQSLFEQSLSGLGTGLKD